MTVRACAASPCRAEVYGTAIVNGACAPPYYPPALSEGSVATPCNRIATHTTSPRRNPPIPSSAPFPFTSRSDAR